ncbi:MAG TPA: YciI family protein [Tepidiformaceae bacterium]|nr:YciI family protein [Tepidiformaceae bacterium]
MRFMLLLYDEEPTLETPEDPAIFEAYAAVDEDMAAKGALVYGQALELSPTARSVRKTADGVMVTDGPFIETREQLGGFYIIECLSQEAAQGYAAKIPAAATGRVEARTMAGHERRLLEASARPHFMVLIYGDESRFSPLGSPEQNGIVGGHQRFTAALIESGEFVTGDGLWLSKTAATVTVRDGEVLVTEGPYAETREVLGGFYEVACDSIDRAIELGSRLLFNDNGGIEIRPVLDMGSME